MKKQWIETINNAWEDRTLLNQENTQNTIHQIIEEVDKGRLRVAEPENQNWKVNDWIKKAIILYFPIQKMETIEIGPLEFHDKMKSVPITKSADASTADTMRALLTSVEPSS